MITVLFQVRGPGTNQGYRLIQKALCVWDAYQQIKDKDTSQWIITEIQTFPYLEEKSKLSTGQEEK